MYEQLSEISNPIILSEDRILVKVHVSPNEAARVTGVLQTQFGGKKWWQGLWEVDSNITTPPPTLGPEDFTTPEAWTLFITNYDLPFNILNFIEIVEIPDNHILVDLTNPYAWRQLLGYKGRQVAKRIWLIQLPTPDTEYIDDRED